MPEKKTSNMLVRDIPIDVWERIDKLCRRRSLKRRDFVEQALRFFEGEGAEQDEKEPESGKPPGFDRLKRDLEDLKRKIKKDKGKDKKKVEQKIDTPDQEYMVGMDQLKPESDSKLIMKHLASSNRASSVEEKNKDRPKVEQRIDTSTQKNRVDMEQIKPESDSKLIMKHLTSSNRAPSAEEKKNEVLTTVYCWGLDRPNG
jgi:hypothetical protein